MKDKMNDVLKGLKIEAECVRAEVHRHLAFFDIKLEKKPGVLKKLQSSAQEIKLHLGTRTVPLMEIVDGLVRVQVAMRNDR